MKDGERGALLDYLAEWPEDGRFRQWRIRRILGSANNILYRATCDDADWAVKFTIRDARRRAWREFQALTALAAAGLDIAPPPLHLDEDGYAQPVVVQGWLEGAVSADLPPTEAAWQRLVEHYVTLRTVMPQKTAVTIPPAVINFASPQAAHAGILAQLASLPASAQPPALRELLAHPQLQPEAFPKFPTGPVALCRVDGNTLNFIRRPGAWASVDWENAGWGDPAFELVDVSCHPKYAAVPMTRWRSVWQTYAALAGDETAVARMEGIRPFMLTWWAARLARMLYEAPRGGDQRLAARPAGWEADIGAKMARYLRLAQAAVRGGE